MEVTQFDDKTICNTSPYYGFFYPEILYQLRYATCNSKYNICFIYFIQKDLANKTDQCPRLAVPVILPLEIAAIVCGCLGACVKLVRRKLMSKAQKHYEIKTL